MKPKETVDRLMSKVPEYSRYRWCEAKACGCLGCVQVNDKDRRLTKEEWQDWVARNPKPSLI